MSPTFEWRLLHDGVGKTPNVRCGASSWVYQNDLWVACGEGSGQGKSSEVWRFNTESRAWRCVKVTGDAPPCRDGQSSTYIGNGSFVLFGGQGFAVPNKKLGKESEGLKTQTYCKRDVFNDLWQFDCNSQSWAPIYPNGLSFPMGRRGHSAIFVDQMPPCGPESVPEDSLLVFGGAGIELSKYTEQLYNDLWVYSFKQNIWKRHETRGIDPTPVSEHRVVRSNTDMIVIGGLSSPKPQMGSEVPRPILDVMILDLRTSTWSAVSLSDPFGRPIRLNLLGFSAILDSTVWKETVFHETNGRNQTAKERITAPLESKKLFLFGGLQAVDSKVAATSKANKIRRDFDESVLVLDLLSYSLSQLTVEDGDPPCDRYGHLAFSGMSIEREVEISQFLQADASSGSKSSHYSAMSRPGTSTHGNTSPVARSNPYSVRELPLEETIMYCFGGSSVERGGYCDPQLFALIKHNPVPNLLGIPEQSTTGAHIPHTIGFADEAHDDGIGFQGPINIWASLQNKSNLSHRDSTGKATEMNQPSNWQEMKLSLTSSRSDRIFSKSGVMDQTRESSRLNGRSMSPAATQQCGHDLTSTSMKVSMLLLSEVDFAYRSVGSHNQGSPRSPWHLPKMDLNGTRSSTANSRATMLAGSKSGTWLTSGRASTAPSRLSMTGMHHEEMNLTETKSQRKKRLQDIKAALKPVMKQHSKVTVRESYNKLFPRPYSP